MRFDEILDRLASFPENSITFYDKAGVAVTKRYPEVRADILRAVERLRAWGVESDMRVGIQASNSYEWVVYDMALAHLKCTSVAFPEEFSTQTSAELIEKYELALLLLSRRDKWPAISPGSSTAYIDDDNPDTIEIRPYARKVEEPIFSLTFSSGTAGRIKCLVTNQRGAEDTIASFYRLFDFRSDDSFLVFLPLSSFQQRLMVYAGFYYGFNLLLVNPTQALKAFAELKPTLVLAPPLLYESIHKKFKNAARNLSFGKRAMLRIVSGLSAAMPVPPIRRRLLKICYGKIYESLGGRIRLMWTGMAPIKRSTLEFFAQLRLPLYEAYGLTECGAITTNTAQHNRRGSVGRPVTEGSVFLAPDGEIMVRQQHLQTTGYLDPAQNEQSVTYVGPNLIATGDIGRFDDDGYLYLVGRKKEIIITTQGFKTHPETLEALIDACPEIERSVVFGNDMPYLVALITISQPRTDEVEAVIGKHIAQLNTELTRAGRIARFVITTEQFTRENGFLTRNLKLDRRAIFRHFERQLLERTGQRAKVELPQENVADVNAPATMNISERVRTITAIWREVLHVDQIRRDDNFFDLGGNSLLLSEMQRKISQTFNRDVPLVTLFNHPTVESLARYFDGEPQAVAEEFACVEKQVTNQEAIAIIGMAGRFPGAKNVAELWRNLCAGVESVSTFSDEDLAAAGVDAAVFNRPEYVRSRPVLDDKDLFDAAFFGFNPREAEMMDPQHRLFLECASDALENAAYDPDRYRGKIGVYAGANLSPYVFNALMSLNGIDSMGALQQLAIGNGLGTLATRASYKLNLKGPGVSVQTACSTSLAAVHIARQSLLNRECDIALAGGVSIINFKNEGYLYEEGGVLSRDGHCRAFDANAQGTIVGDGVALVVLKRLSEAVADGDTIHAVLLGSAMNNDGSAKIGFTAPSVDGQAAAIRAAQADAGVTADTISYVEAHGTGTLLGDPIEVQALTNAFRATTDKKAFCGLGSIKTNIGHLDSAAGVAGLIKATLALKHKQIPPSLNFAAPNPQIDFANSPFYVNDTLAEWTRNGHPRRAGVSSFGFGGTNVHVVLEEPPETLIETGPARPSNLIVMSAQTEQALMAVSENLKTHLEENPDLNPTDVAYTCQTGRKAFNERAAIVCSDVQDCVHALANGDRRRVLRGTLSDEEPYVVFMFPGQGAQHANMTAELYRTEDTFKKVVDQCCDYLEPRLGFDLRPLLFPDEEHAAEATLKLNQTSNTQPALFVIEYALARLWMEWGIQPQAMIGHSIGEYVAACLANVFSLEDALTLVAARGKLIGELPGGAMLAIPFSEAEAAAYLDDGLSLAASNSPTLNVVSGPVEAIDRLEKELSEQNVICHRLHTSHAFHSSMVDPVLDRFTELVTKANPQPPRIPLISNLTGDWMETSDATDPRYWSKHLRHTVRFARGLQTLSQNRRLVLLEVGPGQNLSGLAAGQMNRENCLVVSSLPHPRKPRPEMAAMLEALGRLWVHGVDVHWQSFNSRQRCRRVPLPTYPFERRRYWIEAQPVAVQAPQSISKRAKVADWFYVPGWKQTPSPRVFGTTQNGSTANWLLFSDQTGLGDEFARRLKTNGQTVVTVSAAEQFSQAGADDYTINPRSAADYSKLLKALQADAKIPAKIVHLWNVSLNEVECFEAAQSLGLHSLVFLTKAISQNGITSPTELFVVANDLHSVIGVEDVNTLKSTLLSPCKIIPQEHPQITCRSIDISWPLAKDEEDELVTALLAECHAKSNDPTIAYRGQSRWAQTFEALSIEPAEPGESHLKEGGVYLVVGGLGRIGSVISEYLSETFKARLVWTTRKPVPPRAGWEQWLQTHPEQDAASVAIRKALAVESLGGTVTIITADAGNRRDMEQLASELRERFGQINGIFHAAGHVVMDDEMAQTIQDVKEADYETHFHAKVKGVVILEEIVQELQPDFCCLISSLSSVLGGLGLTAYAAANGFMDAFARSASKRTAIPWSTINLDAWQMDAASLEQTGNLGASLVQTAITPSEGKDVFSRLLPRAGFPQVLVSTTPLQPRIDQWLRFISSRETEQTRREPAKFYPRPALRDEYEAPTTETQEKLAEIWQRVLAIDKVGINDDFFELGGNSLLGTQLVMEMREGFKKSVPLRDFFETPTIAELATLLQNTEATENLPPIKPIPRQSLRVGRESVLAGQ